MSCLRWFGLLDCATGQARDGPPQAGQVALDDPRRVDHAWGVQHRPPRSTVTEWDAIVSMGWRSQHRFQFIPMRVLPGGHRLSYARHAVAQADVAVAADGVGDLGEPAVLLGDHERRRAGRPAVRACPGRIGRGAGCLDGLWSGVGGHAGGYSVR